ncbi:hypothetical protein ZHAS_00004994 [Anopheles sinensis]|uniref:Uncharacterized protein n=1 Tax=Anopheles sinensis TaxID=74873 RepID=A0A084VIN1_ANOSI|nr:hypothetical protein ZHAS_00004994 [Anopheles sinensis]
MKALLVHNRYGEVFSNYRSTKFKLLAPVNDIFWWGRHIYPACDKHTQVLREAASRRTKAEHKRNQRRNLERLPPVRAGGEDKGVRAAAKTTAKEVTVRGPNTIARQCERLSPNPSCWPECEIMLQKNRTGTVNQLRPGRRSHRTICGQHMLAMANKRRQNVDMKEKDPTANRVLGRKKRDESGSLLSGQKTVLRVPCSFLNVRVAYSIVTET